MSDVKERGKKEKSCSGIFMFYCVPYLNLFWGKTTLTQNPLIIRPHFKQTYRTKVKYETETLQSQQSFRIQNEMYILPITKDGKTKEKAICDLWLKSKHLKAYTDISFSPDLTHDDTTYNVFHGFAITEEIETSKQDILEHLKPLLDHYLNIWCKGNQALFEYVID